MKIERKVVRRNHTHVAEPEGLKEEERTIWWALVKHGPLTEHGLQKETELEEWQIKINLHTLKAAGHVVQKGWKFRLRWQDA